MTEASGPARIFVPGLSSEEETSKRLAVQLLQTIERGTYSNREILGACAVLAACTIKARYPYIQRDQTFRAFVDMAQNVLGQF